MGEKDREQILLRLLREKAGDVPHATYFTGLRERIVDRLTSETAPARVPGRGLVWRRPVFPAILGSAAALVLFFALRPSETGMESPTETPSAPIIVDGSSTNSAPAGVFDPPGGGATYPASLD